ncbi:ABC transporter permease [Agaribacter marinus]|uniref:Antimicrobial peptide ABC transporter permease SapB n=1 Tax=Agaribacter marinus TaxID=1431249 RepID=A0AA37SZ09_9ALTE|nr:ABC transporter permease [Agaribacter marinus]GLR70665.1 antimicrobial peptide ABC transporter permease SapB [Agaribacter marinus]
MIRLCIRYLNLIVLTILALIGLSFLLPFLFPGDLLTNISGITPDSNQQREALERAFKLDKSLFSQFIHYLENLFAGNWGVSNRTQLDLFDEIALTFPATIELVVYASVVSVTIGIPLGFISGLKHHNPFDFSVVTFSIVAYSFPVFWLALIFITVFSLQLEWLPTSGRIDLLFEVPSVTGFILVDIWLSDIPNKGYAFKDALQHLILPTISVAIVTTALFVRFVRRSIMDVMEKEYIIAAKSRGFTQRQIFFKHGLKNAIIPILPILALQVSTLITNVMIVETIFSWPGIGKWLIEAIYQRDYPAIRMGMLIVSLFVMILTISTEFLTRAIDPARERGVNATL